MHCMQAVSSAELQHTHTHTHSFYLSYNVAHNTLLPVPTAELVSQLRPPCVTYDEFDVVVTVIVGCE